MDDEPWEQSLDIDDSDLLSLLRPCKRRRSTPEEFPDPPSSATSSPEPPSTATTIPGPAGAVQAAMRRKDLDRRNYHSNGSNGDDDINGYKGVISTQEYIRSAMSDTTEFDDDFTRTPWLSALKSLGGADGAMKSTPISSIKKYTSYGKIDLFVAVIKSCTPNGLGGLMVTLKDLSGTIGGSVHPRVLGESDFGKNFTVGAVVVLKKVAIFASGTTSPYLNIMLNNLVKVFCQDGGSISKLNTGSCTIQCSDPEIEYCGESNGPEYMPTAQHVTIEETAMEKQLCTDRDDNLRSPNKFQEQSHRVAQFVQVTERVNLKENVTVMRGLRDLDVDQSKKLPKGITAFDQDLVNASGFSAKESNSDKCYVTNSVAVRLVGKRGDEEKTNEVQIQKKQPQSISKPSLPHWTDEQLDELFAGDEDDGSLFF